MFTTRDGLTQLQVRGFLEDSRGYVWVGTQAGLNRFDGRNLEPFGVRQGLPGEKIERMVEGLDGAIWYKTPQGVFRFDGARNTPVPASAIINDSTPFRLWVLMPDSIPKFAAHRYPCLRDVLPQNVLFFYDGERAGLFLRDKKIMLILDRDGCREAPVPVLRTGSFSPTRDFRHFKEDGQIFYSLTADGLQLVARYEPSLDSMLWMHPTAPTSLEVVGSRSGARYWIREGERYVRLQLDDSHFNRIDHIYMDLLGRVHVATDEGYAVIHAGGLENFRVPGLQYPWTVLPASAGEVWISDRQGGLARVGDSGLPRWIRFAPDGNPNHQLFPGQLKDKNGRILLGGYECFYYLERDLLRRFPIGETIEALAWDERRQVYVVCGKRLYRVNAQLTRVTDTISLPPEFNWEGVATDIEISPDGAYWVSTWVGIYRLPPDSEDWEVFSQKNGKMPAYKINTLRTDSTGVLWAGADGGLLRYDPKIGQFVRVLPERIEATSNVNCLELLPQNELCVLTDRELIILRIGNPEKPLLRASFGTLNGFDLLEPSENGACWDGRRLWIPAAKGFQRLEWGKIQPPPRPVLRLDRLNDVLLPFALDTSVLVVGESIAKVRPSCINNELNTVKYEYTLDGGAWIPVEANPDIMIRGLQHGLNALRVRARLPGRPESDWPVASATIRAQLPFRQRQEFWLFAVALICALVVTVLGAGLQRYRQRRRAKRLGEQLAVARLQTVMAQLNPHVQFNLLSSLQNYIQNRSKEEAGRHLLRISRFIREVLEQSMPGETDGGFPFPVIPLSREIDALRNYLELESDQQAGKLRFDIHFEGASDPEKLCIPPQLVQPLVENAVIHGVKPLNRPGYISVVFRENGDQLAVLVTDDGAGVPTQATRPRSGLQKSWGGQLLRERLNILSELGYPARLEHTNPPGGGAVFTITIKKMLCASF